MKQIDLYGKKINLLIKNLLIYADNSWAISHTINYTQEELARKLRDNISCRYITVSFKEYKEIEKLPEEKDGVIKFIDINALLGSKLRRN